jgi:hypothetical protein
MQQIRSLDGGLDWLGQWWLCEVLVFGGSLVDVTTTFSMVEGVMLCTVAKVVVWQAWCASSTATMVEGVECGSVYLWEVHLVLLIDDDGPARSSWFVFGGWSF